MNTSDKTYKATLRHAKMSAQKIRPFADLVRGKFAEEALEILAAYPSRGAFMISALIKSALANAEDRRASNLSDLEIVRIQVDGGPMIKRFRPKSRGSSSVILKRLSHITVEIG